MRACLRVFHQEMALDREKNYYLVKLHRKVAVYQYLCRRAQLCGRYLSVFCFVPVGPARRAGPGPGAANGWCCGHIGLPGSALCGGEHSQT